MPIRSGTRGATAAEGPVSYGAHAVRSTCLRRGQQWTSHQLHRFGALTAIALDPPV